MNKYQEGVQQQKKVIEQLRTEASVTRHPISQTTEEMMQYCLKQQDNDVLITGFAKQSDNPFKEKGGCTIL